MPELEKEGIQQTAIPDFAVETLARLLLPALQAFYESPEGRAEFEAWKAEQTNTT